MAKIDRHQELLYLRARVKDLYDKVAQVKEGIEHVNKDISATINNVDSILNVDKLDLWKEREIKNDD